jgi:hypothetical protein
MTGDLGGYRSILISVSEDLTDSLVTSLTINARIT